MRGFTKNSRTAYLCPFPSATYRNCPYLFIFAKQTHQNSHTHKYWNFYRSNDSDFRFGKFLNKIKESLSLIKDHSKNQKQKQNSYLAENHSLSWMLIQEKQNIPIWVYWVSARLNISYIIRIWYQGYRSIGDNNVLNFKMGEIVTRFFQTNIIYCSQWNTIFIEESKCSLIPVTMFKVNFQVFFDELKDLVCKFRSKKGLHQFYLE